MTIDDIITYMLDTYPGTKVNHNWGEKGVFYNPDNLLAKGIYILTFKEKDGANDSASHLNRGDMYRLNVGISKPSFIKRFGYVPKRPQAGQTVAMECDFQQVNTILPHPVYGWMSWIAVINPTAELFEQELKPYLDEGYQLALAKYKKKVRKL